MAEAGPVAFYGRRLARNAWAGVKLAFFVPLREHEFRVSALDYAFLAAAGFLAWIAAAAVQADYGGEFDPYAVVLYLATAGLVLGTSLLLAHAYHAPQRLLLFAVALISADPLFQLIGLGVPALGERLGVPQLASIAFLAWTWIASLRVVLVCGGRQRPQVYQGMLAVTAMTIISLYVFPQTDVWLPPEDEDEMHETTQGGKVLRMGADAAGAFELKHLADEPHQGAQDKRARQGNVVHATAHRNAKVAGQAADAAPAQLRRSDRYNHEDHDQRHEPLQHD
jgi:hypothetical protein